MAGARPTPAALVSVVVAAVAATAFAGVGVLRGTFAVGGSDSSCYALMADAFAHGRLQPESSLAPRAPWPAADATFAPGGFIPSPVSSGASSPICAPGFSVLMTPFRWLGLDGIFFLVPVTGFVLIGSVFVIARALGDPRAGALAAVVAAASPVALFQVVQPMNDIPTAACWAAVVAAGTIAAPRRWWVMGGSLGVAVLVRPNLVPAAAVVGLWAAITGGTGGAIRVALAALPGSLLVLWFNHALYGHPLQTGYGQPADLFSVAHVPVNAAHYGRALLETQTPFPWLALLAPAVMPREQRPVMWLIVGVVLTIVAVYLLYYPFPEWWYLRFMLPALGLVIALASVVAVRGIDRLPRRMAAVMLVLLAAALAAFGVFTAAERAVFDLQRLESRFRLTGHVVRDRLPQSVLIASWPSGAIRYFAGREVMVWDALDPAWLDRAIEWVAARNLEPLIVIERREEAAFRSRFGDHAVVGGLDWPPRLDLAREVRIYAPLDRSRYMAGQPIPTELVPSPRWRRGR